jgi:hypothetical protein
MFTTVHTAHTGTYRTYSACSTYKAYMLLLMVYTLCTHRRSVVHLSFLCFMFKKIQHNHVRPTHIIEDIHAVHTVHTSTLLRTQHRLAHDGRITQHLKYLEPPRPLGTRSRQLPLQRRALPHVLPHNIHACMQLVDLLLVFCNLSA